MSGVTNGEAALRYIAAGWPVFPIYEPKGSGCACGNRACESPAKHPRTKHGVKDASLTVAQVLRWWKTWPDASIAIAVGRHAGVAIVDVDRKSGGLETLAELQLEHGPMPDTLTVETGGGGVHLYFRHPGVAIGNRAGVLPGTDTRDCGGYVIAPPSLHISGRCYEWSKLGGSKLATMPEWLLNRLRQGTERGSKPIVPAGLPICRDRNETLFGLGTAMRRRGACHAAILAALEAENRERCKPPLDADEVAKIAGSASRYDPADSVTALARLDALLASRLGRGDVNAA